MNRARTFIAAVLILVTVPLFSAEAIAVRAVRPPKNTLAPAAIKRAQNLSLGALKEGNNRFVKGEVKAGLESSGKWAQLAKGQRPWAMVIACSDSRVAPEILFTRKPGDLFVCRVAGNVADKDLVASLEYGAEHLEIPVLVVLGHSSCGTVKAAVDFYEPGVKHAEPLSFNMESLLGKIEPSVRATQKARRAKNYTHEGVMDLAVETNVRNTMRTVLETSPLLWQMWHEQRLRVAGAVYSLETGKVKWLE